MNATNPNSQTPRSSPRPLHLKAKSCTYRTLAPIDTPKQNADNPIIASLRQLIRNFSASPQILSILVSNIVSIVLPPAHEFKLPRATDTLHPQLPVSKRSDRAVVEVSIVLRRDELVASVLRGTGDDLSAVGTAHREALADCCVGDKKVGCC